MILQYKISQRNLTAIKLSQYYYAYRLHTFKKNVTNINFLSRPGPNVPYICAVFGNIVTTILHDDLLGVHGVGVHDEGLVVGA